MQLVRKRRKRDCLELLVSNRKKAQKSRNSRWMKIETLVGLLMKLSHNTGRGRAVTYFDDIFTLVLRMQGSFSHRPIKYAKSRKELSY